MQQRYHMDNGRVMVEHHYRETLESIRRTDKRFKGRRIRQVLQTYPSRVQVGVVYKCGSKYPQPA